MKKCPHCAEEVQEAARICPYCQRRLHKSFALSFGGGDGKSFFARHKILTGIIILFGLGFVGSLLGGSDDKPVPQTPPSANQMAERPGERELEIFQAVQAAERQALEEADAKYPVDANDPSLPEENVEKNATLYQELVAEAHAKVQAQYGISEDEMWEIISEAIEKQWPAK